jgi:hypothetical protein
MPYIAIKSPTHASLYKTTALLAGVEGPGEWYASINAMLNQSPNQVPQLMLLYAVEDK